MVGLQEKVCRVANRISTTVGFVKGSSDEEIIREMFRDGFVHLETMLFELNQTSFRTDVMNVLSEDRRSSIIEADAFTRFQCELLHHVQLHERSITNIGNHLVKWRPTPVAADRVGCDLSELEYVVACEAGQLASTWSDAELRIVNQRVGSLHAIANGLAVMVVNVVEMDGRFKRLAVTYGASLVARGLSNIRSVAPNHVAANHAAANHAAASHVVSDHIVSDH